MTEAAPKVRNKRLAVRRATKRTTKAICYKNALGLGPNVAHSVLDLSETGVRLILKTELEVGRFVQIDLESTSQRMVKTQAVVVWILPISEGKFCAGFKFEKAIAWSSFLLLSNL